MTVRGTLAGSPTTPSITIAAGTSPVTEGTAAQFTVTASTAPTANLTVNLTVADATGTSDFVASGDEGSKTVTINANQTEATHSVPTTNDTTDEPNGNVTVTVATGTGYTVGTASSASVMVNDNDDPPNRAPVFAASSHTRNIAENSAANTNVGAVIPAATDADNDTLTYTMEGTDSSSFTFDASTRQIKTKSGVTYNFEATKNSYSVTIKAADASASDTVDVTINVTDVNEPPTAPTSVTVATTSGSANSIDISWTAPTNTGKPDISEYDVRYFKGTADPANEADWIEEGETGGYTHSGTGTSGSIASLDANSTYRVQVRAKNNEGTGPWSSSGSGSTSNSAPVFAASSHTRNIAENSGANTNVGAVIPAATDADNDTLTYTMEGTDASSFTFDASTRQIKTKSGVTYDHEATKNSYSVTIKAADAGASDTVDVTINVTDVNEPPTAPTSVTVATTSGSANSIDISWTAPTNTGKPDISEYDVRYFKGTADPSNAADWIEEGETGGYTHSGTGTSGSIASLDANSTYRVQVRAKNNEGTGPWSSSGSGSTGNSTPVFAVSSHTRNIAENSGANTNVGAVIPAATDADNDTLTYTMEGTDASSFTFDASTRQIKTKSGVTYNFEATKNSYSVTIKAADASANDTVDVTINVTDVNEPPTAPTSVTVATTSGSANSIDISWTAPTNTGKPDISEYDVRYFKGTADPSNAADWIEEGETGGYTHSGTGTSGSIASLDANSTYRVQVRAKNNEGTGPWSSSGSGSTGNSTPVFAVSSHTRNIAENSGANTNVGAVIPAATDADGDTLTYTMEGTDASSFTFDASTRQIKTKSGVTYDHEATKNSYSVTIKAADASANDTVDVTINVTDVNEPPTAPTSVTVATTSGSANSIDISWTAPTNTGKPDISEYDVRYFKGTADPSNAADWIEEGETGGYTHSGTGTSGSIASLDANSTYRVQVRAKNNEGTGPWSSSGSGSTGNSTPVFAVSSHTRNIAENSGANTNVGAVIPAATDADGDTLTYTMEGTDASSFTFDASTRQIKTKSGVTYNFEATKNSYSVTIKAADASANDTVDVTINVTDVNEPPTAPTSVTVATTSGSANSIDISWTAPTNTGKPDISEYDVRYFKGTADPSNAADWIEEGETGGYTHSGTGTSGSIASLDANSTYRVQVRAKNNEGTGPWSSTGSGSTGNTTPSFSSSQPTTASVNENSAAGTSVVTVVATDPDTGDSITYSLDSTSDTKFNINTSTGQITVQANDSLDHEANSSITATVTATDEQNATATRNVAITINDVNEPPIAPGAPTVTGASTTSVTVSWSAPTNTGKPAINDYDVQQRVQGTSSWTSHAFTGSGTTTTISNLLAGTNYQVQVKAKNPEGESSWSATGSGLTLNTAPTFTSPPSSLNVPENSGGGTSVGTVAATDADGHSLTYELDSTSDAVFNISGSGAITVQSGANLNHEGTSRYNATVTVKDGRADGTVTHNVTINVTDVNEPPGTPSTPTVSGASTTSLRVIWTAPDMTGKPPISDNDIRYRVVGTQSWTDANNNGTSTNVIVSGLLAGTNYQVQVQAKNDEGNSSWSATGSGLTLNTPPTFTSRPGSLSINENSTAGSSVGSVPATDADGHSLTYELSGAAAAVFSISSTGAISLRSGASLNHEATSSYAATVTVRDGRADGTVTHSFTINIADVNEPPTAPATPTVIGLSESSLEVRWTAPNVTGKPPITDYDIRYYRGTSDPISAVAWIEESDSGGHRHTGTATTTTITGLFGGYAYRVQVSAKNDEGTSPWSTSGSGATNTASNTAPTFDSPPSSFDIAENSEGGTTIGTITASDADGDDVSYALDSTSDELFDISSNGVITLQDDAVLDFEAASSITVTVIVNDGIVNANHTLTINVIDVNEPPDAPAAPSVMGASSSSITVTWVEPDVSDKPPITDYDLRYFKGSAPPDDPEDWIEPGENDGHDHDGPATTATIVGLDADSEYQVQILARNNEGRSGWSAAGEGSTNPPEAAPLVEQVQLVSAPPGGQSNTYKPGDTLRARVSFDTPVDVVGDPVLRAQFGSRSETVQASLAFNSSLCTTMRHLCQAADSGQVDMVFDESGGRINVMDLNFTYDIEEGVLSDEGVSFDANALHVPEGASIRASGQTVDANLKSAPVETDSNHKVDGAPPVLIDNLAIQVSSFAGIDNAYAIGDDLEITAVFNEAVDVTPIGDPVEGPRIAFQLGGETKYAIYDRTDGERVVFQYTVLEGDEDTNSIDVESNALTLNGAAIADLLGNGAGLLQLAHAALTTIGHNVDGVRPTVESASVNASILRITFNETLDSLNATPPSGSDFTLAASNRSGSRTINGTSEPVLVNDTLVTIVLDGEVANGETASVSYEDSASGGFEDLVGNAARAFSDQEVVNRTPRPGENSAPIFTRRPRTLNVAENSSSGTTVGRVTATDDDGDSLIFSLDSASAMLFVIDDTGIITVLPGTTLDHEVTSSYSMTITVDDGVAVATHDLTVQVTDELEPPDAPATPTVATTFSDIINVSWIAPEVQGKPEITDYDVRYRVAGTMDWQDASFKGVATTTTISDLAESTTYEVQIRASNDEGTSGWSVSGTATTLRVSNVAPVFVETTPVELDLPENSDGGSVLATIVATDSDGDPLTYSLDKPAELLFDIDADGVLTLQDDAVLDFEAITSYVIEVTVADGFVVVTHRLTVNITDVDEPPLAPDMPRMEGLSPTSVDVTWAVPDESGIPAISDYDVRYRATGVTRWTDVPFEGTDTNITLTELKPDTSYQAQVRATNDEGTSEWSEIGTGMTNPPPNRAPTFNPAAPTTLEIAEDRQGGTRVGKFSANDLDDDTLSYSLDSVSEMTFDIDSNGVMTLKDDVTLDFETTPLFEVTVTVSDGEEETTHQLTITVTDVDEPPDTPEAPTLASDSPTSLSVSWIAPDTRGKPPITDYDVRHRESRATAWIEAAFEGTDTTAVISGLKGKSTYDVQVRATNAEGTSEWSASASARTLNSAPTFAASASSLVVAENIRGGTSVGSVVATDADGDELSYSLDDVSAGVFTIDARGAIMLRIDATLDFETTPSYEVTVSVTDGTAVVEHRLTIDVTDVDELPGKPNAPSLSTPGSDPMGSVAVRWNVPANQGSAIRDYDVRFRSSAESNWSDAGFNGATTSTTITGLIAGTTYEVQVRASNSDGTGEWSDSSVYKVLGATITDAALIGSSWLARFGRTFTDDLSDAISTRLSTSRTSQSKMTLGGHALAGPIVSDVDAFEQWVAPYAVNIQPNSFSHSVANRSPVESRAISPDLLSDSSFDIRVNANGKNGRGASLWGRGGIARFESLDDGLSIEGTVKTGFLATDLRSNPQSQTNRSRWTIGLALGHAVGSGDYRDSGGIGDVDTRIAGLFPYGALSLSDRLSVWSTIGYGSGELTLAPEGHTPLTADVSLTTSAFGLRSEIRQRNTNGGLSLAIKGDARFTQTSSDEASSPAIRFDAVESESTLARLGIEGSGSVTFGDGSTLVPVLEVALRFDRGDAETGHGADVSGGLSFSDSRNIARFDLKARRLVTHEVSEYREWGASAAFTWDPNPISEEGISLSLKQSLGVSPTGGMDALFARETLLGFGRTVETENLVRSFQAAKWFEGELSYGLPAFSTGIRSAPYVGVGVSDVARDWRAGWRFNVTDFITGGMTFNIDATHRESVDEVLPASYGVLLRGSFHW